ncbi:hypothetical protein FWF74_03525 [Candidatus Saccharibacteria bacterium]|nr:hypothetical protein [Candidatus Saccharibacteria bacterium]MCL1962844.1 hypothetical protein [Candidatus Saccharibacteria bacterium]
MDKDILTHKGFIEDKIAKLHGKDGKDKEKARDLARYHTEMTRNFQHERQIHLFVMLFFALLMIGSWAFCGWSFTVATGGISIDSLSLPAIILTVIITTLEIFYIRYYYRLENRTQKLYVLDKKIFEIIES